MFINIFVFQPTYVDGMSMEPTLHDGDRLIINKIPHTFNLKPAYGDIVVIDSRVDNPRTVKDDITENFRNNAISILLLKLPQDEFYWIKRVVGKPGDVIEFKSGKLVRNGKVIDESYIAETMDYASNEKITVPDGSIFVMGDNRNHSKDSRYIGCVPFSHIIGKYIVKL
jgi:signal peptidase I